MDVLVTWTRQCKSRHLNADVSENPDISNTKFDAFPGSAKSMRLSTSNEENHTVIFCTPGVTGSHNVTSSDSSMSRIAPCHPLSFSPFVKLQICLCALSLSLNKAPAHKFRLLARPPLQSGARSMGTSGPRSSPSEPRSALGCTRGLHRRHVSPSLTCPKSLRNRNQVICKPRKKP